jgi:transcriptional regulator with XRE-family HTH domain
VREYRTTFHLTVAELALRAGISKAMLSKIENSKISPGLATMARLAVALNVPVTALLRGIDDDDEAIHVQAGGGIILQQKDLVAGAEVRSLGVLRGIHQRLEPTITTYRKQSDRFPIRKHGGTEFIQVLEGALDFGVGSVTYRLAAGDSLQFPGQVSHGIVRLVELPVSVLSVKGWGIVRDPMTRN